MRILLVTILALWQISFAAAADTPRVLTDIAPVQSLVAMVMGNVGAPDVLLDGNTDPHHIQLRPSQVRAIARADLVFWIGEPLTPWLSDPLQSIGKSGASIALLQVPGTDLRYFDEAQVDPHAWLDPENANLWLDAIASILARADPAHGNTYKANASLGKIAIGKLTKETRQALAGVQGKNLITAHDSLGYFADRFDLTIVATISDGEANPPGPAHITALRKIIADNDVACVLSEYGQPADLIRTTTEGFVVQSAAVDSTGALLSTGAELYPEMIRAMAKTIAGCIDGKG